jgi:hypothetical protein
MITKAVINEWRQLQFSLPETELVAGATIPVGFFELTKPATLKWFSVQVVKIVELTGPTVKINSGLNDVYLCVREADNVLKRFSPNGIPLVYAGTDGAGIDYRNPTVPITLAPGGYSILAVNNTSTHDYSVVASAVVIYYC